MLVNMGPDISQNEITSYLARLYPHRNAKRSSHYFYE